jgi:hypothetical protein
MRNSVSTTKTNLVIIGLATFVFILFLGVYVAQKLQFPQTLTTSDDPYFHVRYAALLAEGIESPPLPYMSTMNWWGGGTLYNRFGSTNDSSLQGLPCISCRPYYGCVLLGGVTHYTLPISKLNAESRHVNRTSVYIACATRGAIICVPSCVRASFSNINHPFHRTYICAVNA